MNRMAMIQGEARWCKILGKPVDGYNPGEKNKQWEFEVLLDEANATKVTDLGLELQQNDKDPRPFFKFVKRAYNEEGEAKKPIRVVDEEGMDWDRKVSIGNGSVLNVKFNVRDWTFGKKSGRKADVMAVQVWDHVPYEGGEQFPTRDEAPKANQEEWS
jgi:hypothetical protein